MKIIICSSILLDIEENNLLHTLKFFPYPLIVCDFIYKKDIENEFDKEIKILKVLSLNDNTILYINELIKKHKIQSYNNLCSLGLAKQEKSTILTNEFSFRKICEDEGIECFDSLWIINYLKNITT